MWAFKFYYLCSGLTEGLQGFKVPKATVRVFMTEKRVTTLKCSLHLNLIRFSFRYLMITEVFIRTQWEVGSAAASFTAKELASIAFSGNTLPSKDVSSPVRMVLVGLLFAGLPLRDRDEEKRGPGQPAFKA